MTLQMKSLEWCDDKGVGEIIAKPYLKYSMRIVINNKCFELYDDDEFIDRYKSLEEAKDYANGYVLNNVMKKIVSI